MSKKMFEILALILISIVLTACTGNTTKSVTTTTKANNEKTSTTGKITSTTTILTTSTTSRNIETTTTQAIDTTTTQKPVQTYTMQDVGMHSTPDNCWTAINGKVYDISGEASSHPGGTQMYKACGIEGTQMFMGNHKEKTINTINKYYIGELG